MPAPDFAAILTSSAAMTWTASNLMSRDEASNLAARQLLHPVFALCSACGGTGSVGEPGYTYHGIPEPGSYEPCPDCPTIGQLLAIGAAVAVAVQSVAQDGAR